MRRPSGNVTRRASTRGTVFGEITVHDDLVAKFDVTALEAAPRERTRPPALAAPVHHIAGGVLHVDVKVRMGVGPFNFGEGAFEPDGLVSIELRCERVVRPPLL